MKIRAFVLFAFVLSQILAPEAAWPRASASRPPLSVSAPFTISGQVTDLNGKGVAGVTVTATSLVGKILVKDQYNYPVEAAQVFRNGVLAGTTSITGSLVIPDLALNDELVARKKIFEKSTAKNNHSQDSDKNWAYRVYITSLEILAQKEPAPLKVTDPAQDQTLVVRESNTLIGYNMVASVEWDAQAAYLAELAAGFKLASSALYDSSNGQALLERVEINEDSLKMADADIRVEASNQVRPETFGGILTSSGAVWKSYMHFGRYWSGGTAERGDWTHADAYRTVIHEFGHYAFDLYDSYFYLIEMKPFRINGSCTDPLVKEENVTDAATNASVMYHQYNATEFAMRGVSRAWSDLCETTQQWYKHGVSDWETIKTQTEDLWSVPSRWKIKTPADYGEIVPGPDKIPVKDWVQVQVLNNNDSAICKTLPEYEIYHREGSEAQGADVYLGKNGRTLYQGKTNPVGFIQLLGAANGDNLYANITHLREEAQDVIVSKVSCASQQAQAADAGPVNLTLQPAAFNLEVTAAPASQADTLEIVVRASAALNGSPQVQLTQDGASAALLVPLTYDSGLSAYRGTQLLDASLPRSGSLLVTAADQSAHTVTVGAPFSLAAVEASQATTLYSTDGQVDLYLPANALSGSGSLSIQPRASVGDLPAGYQLASGPYEIRAGGGAALQGEANLALRIVENGSGMFRLENGQARLAKWDGSQWSFLVSTPGEAEASVSGVIDSLGTFAALAQPLQPLFLPLASYHARPGQVQSAPAGPEEAAETLPAGQADTPAQPAAPAYSAVTNSNGEYTITGLPGGTYKVVPGQQGAFFDPPYRMVPVTANVGGVDFRFGTCTSEVLIPAGTFQMGCDSSRTTCYHGETPLHTVELPAYSIDRCEVTNARYASCVAEGDCTPPVFDWSATHRPYYGAAAYGNYPVMNVNWEQALEFCEWDGKRLPTEAEWEKAGRGSSDTRLYPWGDQPKSCTRANLSLSNGACVGDAVAVGSYPDGASPYGVMDMAGNVREWVSDWYSDTYYSNSPAYNPQGPDWGSNKGVRGGSWDDTNPTLVYFRDYDGPTSWLMHHIGFRCAH
jgi:formylglycine-generating enzyme required for sulfatase activity